MKPEQLEAFIRTLPNVNLCSWQQRNATASQEEFVVSLSDLDNDYVIEMVERYLDKYEDGITSDEREHEVEVLLDGKSNLNFRVLVN